MTKIEELKAAYEAATPGEWKPCRSHEEFSGPSFDPDWHPENMAKAQAVMAERHYQGRITRYKPVMEGKGPLRTKAIAEAVGVHPSLARQQLALLARDGFIRRVEGKPTRYEWKGLK